MQINLADQATGTLADASFPTSVARKSDVQQATATYAADTGTANAYAVSLTPTPSVATGFWVTVKIAHASTGASTLAINGGSAIAIKKNGNSTNIASGDLSVGQIVTFTYDGTVFQCMIPGAGAVSSVTTTGTAGASTLISGVLNIPIYNGVGGAVLSRTRYATNRSANTVYQNTTGGPIIVMIYVFASSTVTGTFLTDSSNPPTTQRATGLAPGGGFTIASFVASGNYYKVVGTGLTVNSWDEYAILSGSFTDSSELSGSRAVSTVYQNTSGSTMFLQVQSTAQTGDMAVISDAASTPTTTVWNNRPAASGTLTTFVPIPNNHYYEVTGATISSWREPTLSVACTKSANLTSVRASLVSFPNLTGKTMFILVVAGATSSKFTQDVYCDAEAAQSTSTFIGNSAMGNEGPGTGLTSCINIAQPGDFTFTSYDSVAYTITSWWEYQLG